VAIGVFVLSGSVIMVIELSAGNPSHVRLGPFSPWRSIMVLVLPTR
jgi:hypothetical protein